MKHSLGAPGAVLALSTSLLLATMAQGQRADTTPTDATACAALSHKIIPGSAIGLPTTGAKVEAATFETTNAGRPIIGGFCKILGGISPIDPSAPPIHFEINLPSTWNGKAVQLGGGFFDGTLVTGLGSTVGAKPGSPSPIVQGYVTLGSDSGHEGKAVDDASFAQNPESLRNFAGDQIKKTHDVAMALMQARYGKAPDHFYFVGGSQGGHEALIAAQRFGKDYDGAVSVFPAYNLTALHLASNAIAKAGYANGGAGWLSAGRLKMLHQAVLDACDGLDGLKDAIVSNVAACRRIFTVDTVRSKLRCPDGVDAGEGCLSDAQIRTVEVVDSPFVLKFALKDGARSFPRWPLLEGATFFDGFGESKTPSRPGGENDSMLYRISDASIRYILTNDPAMNTLNAFNPVDHRKQIVAASELLDSTETNLDSFHANHGKLMLVHGSADESVTPYNTVAYYDRLLKRYGPGPLKAFARFYLVPGYGHYSGVFNARWDPLDVLDAWVVKGEAPDTLVAVDGNKGPERSRPMCVYPGWPMYKGAGNSNSASSFRCAQQ